MRQKIYILLIFIFLGFQNNINSTTSVETDLIEYIETSESNNNETPEKDFAEETVESDYINNYYNSNLLSCTISTFTYCSCPTYDTNSKTTVPPPEAL